MKDLIRMNQLAGIITEGQARKMMEILNEELRDNKLNITLYSNDSGLAPGNLSKENITNQRKIEESLKNGIPVEFVIRYATDNGSATNELVVGTLNPIRTSSSGKIGVTNIELSQKYAKSNANYKGQETISDAIKLIMQMGQFNAKEFIKR